MFCNQCGAKLPDGSKFCNNCGADLSALLNKAEEVAPNAAEEPAPQSQPAPVQQPAQPQPAPTPVQPQPTPVQQQAQPQPAPTPVQPQPTPVQPQPTPVQPQPTPVQPQPAPVQGMPGYGGQNMNQTYTQPGQMQQNAPNMQQQQFNGYAAPGYNPGNPYQQGAMPVQQPKKKSKAPIIIAIVAVIVAALVIVEFTLHPIANLLKPKGNEAATQYAALCDMTSLGTQSYLNARLLTEQLVETDLATADTDSVNELFEKCLAAWDAMELVTEQIDKIAEKLQSLPDFAKLSITKTEAFSLIPVAHAASPGEAASDAISNAQTPQAAVGTATRLSRQMAGDTAGARDNVRRMQQVYNGRQTNLNDWQSATSNTVGSFSAVVFISGEITQANGVTPSSDARGIRSLGNSVKGGGLVLDNTNIVADVGDDTTTFVMGQGTSVVMPDEEIGGSLPGGDSDVITVNTYPEDPNESGISFHENGLSSWFITGRIGGFSITRGSKGEGEEEEIYPEDPVVSGGSFEADPDGDDNSVNEDLVDVCGIPPIEPTRGPITDIIPPIHTDDVVGEVANITRTTGGNGSDSEGTGNDNTTSTPQTGNVDAETLVERIEQEGGGTGDITVSMLWGTHDDLDLHMNTPDGSHIYYSNKTAGGGTLDIDMNAGGELSTSPVENIYFPTPSEGHYKVFIRDYRDRTADMSTHYLVKVLINGQERLFEGDIDNTGTEIVVFEFDYVLPEDPTVIQPPTAENLAEWLSEAGAGVGEITVSLAWNCFDDVDLHMNTPDGSHIYYSHRTGQGGELDVDANAGGGQTMTPVENIYFPMPSNGHYKVWINQYRDRTPDSSADYIVKVTVGENEQIFTGTIDTSGTDIDIVEFDYGGASDGEGSDFEGHRYVFYNDNGQMSWTQAREYCQQQGGHLVTITSAAEQEFISSQYPGKDAWIGGYGDALGFMWITGEDFSYTNWASNQPDNANGDEWYMHLWGGVWNDLNNDDSTYHYHNGFICEWDSMTDLNVERLIHVLDDLDAASGAITVSMMWDSADDLDLHVFTPDGSELYYDNPSVAGGALDIDANRNDDSIMESPVENVYFDDPQPGEYWVYLYDYTDRSDGPTNYIVRVDVGGQSQTFTGTVEGSGDTVEITGFVYGE